MLVRQRICNQYEVEMYFSVILCEGQRTYHALPMCEHWPVWGE
jgi:hypothetical protein